MSSQDSLMDDSEVEDPMSPSPSPVKKQVKRRKQSASTLSSGSAGSAGSASRAGSGSSGAAGWNEPLRPDTSRDKRKGKRPSPSTAANVGEPSLSGKSVHDGRARIWDRPALLLHYSYFARKSLSHTHCDTIVSHSNISSRCRRRNTSNG